MSLKILGARAEFLDDGGESDLGKLVGVGASSSSCTRSRDGGAGVDSGAACVGSEVGSVDVKSGTGVSPGVAVGGMAWGCAGSSEPHAVLARTIAMVARSMALVAFTTMYGLLHYKGCVGPSLPCRP